MLSILGRDLAVLVQVKLILELRLDQDPVHLDVSCIRQHLERHKTKSCDQQKHLAQLLEQVSRTDSHGSAKAQFLGVDGGILAARRSSS